MDNKPPSTSCSNQAMPQMATYEASQDTPDTPDAIASERSLIYLWFSGLFARELSEEMLAQYRGPEGTRFLSAIAEHKALAPLATTLAKLMIQEPSNAKLALDLAGSFARLFHGVGGRQSAPACESAYHGEQNRLYQQPVAEMNNLLRSLDVSLPPDFHEPPDHIAVQLAVMAKLETIGDRQEQSNFLEEHLLKWLPAFAQQCQRGDQLGLYASAASALLAYLRTEYTAIDLQKQHRPH